MGQEIACSMRHGGRTLAGKACLETDCVLFRGDERLKIPFQKLTSVSDSDGVLRLEFAGGQAELELGSTAAKWAAKIQNPPSRAAKLGLKTGMAVRLEGEFDESFREELRGAGAAAAGARAKADLVFFAADRTPNLVKLDKLLTFLRPEGAMWVVYPKGVAAIREAEVIEAGRSVGMKDTKVVAFSRTHTALRFVVTRSAR